ncbi:MAG: glycosyltransferase family 39 protein [Candidatus Levybacteria bacterium]|nr:glycosyltransferase family 39 protein [Candidatus Levybacteria bacterium]
MKKKEFFLLISILILGFVLRLYKFNNPVADWHSWRQADTSAVSRNFIKYGFYVLYPRFDDLSNVPSNFYDNPNGYRFVEFPIYNIIQAGLFKIFGIFTIEQWGRLVSIFSSLLAAIFMYLIVKKYQNNFAGMLALFFFIFLPYNVYYSRTILPDAMMLMTLLGGIYFFDLWLEKNSKLKIYDFRFILSLILIASSFLLKPFALFFTLPLFVLALNKLGLSFLKKWQLWIFLIFSIYPLILWRIWIIQNPEGIPRSDWLFNMNNIRFKGAFFSWIFEKRIATLILGSWGLPLFVLGLIQKVKIKEHLFFLSFVISSLIYIFVVAGGNVHHDYYQIPIVPSLVIFLALGSEYLLKLNSSLIRRGFGLLLFAVCALFMFAFSWQSIRDYYNINNPAIVRAGQAVNNLIPKDAKVIAPYDGDTAFLYQINRQGWASFQEELPKMIMMGADYLVIVNPTGDDIGETYKIISSTPDYILVDLHQKP